MIGQTVQSPCGCEDPFVIDGSTHPVDVSETSLSSSYCYFVKGTLVIDVSTAWYGMRFLMGEESKILVETSLEINNSYISGCDNMWQGIETESSSDLTVYNSYIESANIGIRLGNLTVFQCSNSQFIDNYVGISVGSPFDSISGTPTQISQKGGITGCEFYTNDAVPDPYPGHHYSSWPTTPSHFPFDQGLAAVFVGHSVGLNIGKTNPSIAQRNKIYQMRNGILSYNSTIHIAGTDFYDFEGSLQRYKFDQPTALEVNQHAVYSINSTIEFLENTVTDIMIGAYSWTSSTTFRDNTFDIKNTGSNLILTRGLRTYFNQYLVADNNEINEGHHGIFIQNSHGITEITDNDFDRNITIDNSSGIEILDCRFIPECVLEDNIMDINNASSAIGLSVNQVSFLSANDNDFYFDEESSSAGDDNCGIIGLNSPWNFFRNNDISADANYIEESGNHGMVFTNCVNNGYICNILDSMHTLSRFVMDCYDTYLVATEFRRGRIAFTINGPGEIGEQRHHGNEWLHTYSDGGAVITGEDELGTAHASVFLYDNTPTGASPQLPNDIRPEIVDNGEWFDFDLGGTGLTCDDDDPDIASDPDSLAVRILDLPQFDTLNDQMTWVMKANIFKLMLLDTSLADNSTLDSFFDAEAVKPLGKLVTAHYDLDSRYGIDFKTKSNTLDSIHILSEYVFYIDSILSLSPNDSATWISLRLLKVDTLSDRLDSWINFIEEESSESMSVYEDISDSLAVIMTTNDMEGYYQDALLFKANFLLGDTITTSDSSDIADIAKLCPWEGGPAISVAQSLLTILTDSTMNVEPFDCPVPPSPFVSILDNNPQLAEGHFLTVYPNPANDVVKIRSDFTINSAELRDASNKVLVALKPNSNNVSFQVSSFPAGIYLITTISGDFIRTQRIILIK